MNKKWKWLLITGIVVMQLAGCGNTGDKEAIETVTESAVDVSTADSDNVQSEIKSASASAESMDEEYITEPAELTCVLPEGFEAASGEEGLYIHNSYPADVSTISYVISEGEEDLTQMDMSEYETDIEASFYDTYGDEVDVVITSYEAVKVDGRKGLKIKIEYEFKGIGYEQLVYMIYNGNETHIMNYTQEKGGKWMGKFEESGSKISFRAIE